MNKHELSDFSGECVNRSWLAISDAAEVAGSLSTSSQFLTSFYAGLTPIIGNRAYSVPAMNAGSWI
jgi:hypothetical protein